MRRITTFVGGGGYETKNELNTMSMNNKTIDFYNTLQYIFKKSSLTFVNVPSRKLQCSAVVFMKVTVSEPISLTCL